MTEKDVLMKLTFKRLLMIQILSSLATFIGPMVDGIIISDFLGPAYMAAFGIITPIAILTGAPGPVLCLPQCCFFPGSWA